MKILVSGLLNIETTVSVRQFPINYYPIDYPFFGVNSEVSGVGCNIAEALRALGDDVNLYSFLGNDFEAERILKKLGADGIDTRNIRKSLSRTPASVVLYDPQGKRQIYCDLKDIQEQSLPPCDADEGLRNCSAALLCNIGFNRDVIKRARQLGVLTATDVHVLGNVDDDYNRDFMENADILFLSDENLPCAPDVFVKRLESRYHNRVIVIGMGEKGAMLLDRDKNTVSAINAYRGSKIVNTVGAGDALFSSFMHFYIKGFDPDAALKRAVVFAGVKIGFSGASVGFSREDEIEKIILGGL